MNDLVNEVGWKLWAVSIPTLSKSTAQTNPNLDQIKIGLRDKIHKQKHRLITISYQISLTIFFSSFSFPVCLEKEMT